MIAIKDNNEHCFIRNTKGELELKKEFVEKNKHLITELSTNFVLTEIIADLKSLSIKAMISQGKDKYEVNLATLDALQAIEKLIIK